MKITILFTALLLSITAVAQHNMVYNLEKGGVYPQNQTVVSEQEQVINGMPQDLTTTITTQSDYVVTDIKDGIYYIDVNVKSMTNTTTTSMGNETMSSDGPASNPMNRLFKNLIEDPIKITMNKNGEILSFDNSAQLEGMTEGLDLPEMQLAQIEASMKKEMSAEKQMGNYSQLTKIFPEKEVAVGDTWSKNSKVNSIATIDTKTSYKLESVSDDYYTISSTADVKTPENASTELMGMKAKYDLSGPSSATYTIDRKTGWIKKADFLQQLDGYILIEKSEVMPEEMKMTMKSKTTTTIE